MSDITEENQRLKGINGIDRELTIDERLLQSQQIR